MLGPFWVTAETPNEIVTDQLQIDIIVSAI